jgi:predicted metal-dependent hydrolase
LTHTKKNPDLEKKMYYVHKDQARKFVLRRIVELNAHYNFTYNQIRIKNTSSRWGSCSSAGNLNFQYKLLFLPPHLQDYVLVHELCHLVELNHGEKFWALVGQVIPDYVARKQELVHYQLGEISDSATLDS